MRIHLAWVPNILLKIENFGADFSFCPKFSGFLCVFFGGGVYVMYNVKCNMGYTNLNML